MRYPLQPTCLPGVDHLGPHTSIAQRLPDEGGCRSLAHRAIGAQHGQARCLHRQDLAGPESQVRYGFGLANVQNPAACIVGPLRDLGVLRKQLVEPVDQGHPKIRGLEKGRSNLGRQDSTDGSDPDDTDFGDLPDTLDHFCQGGEDRDLPSSAVENLSRILAGATRVHQTQDPVSTGPAHQTVSGLGERSPQQAVGQEDSGFSHGWGVSVGPDRGARQ